MDDVAATGGRRVLLDVGAHLGETLGVAMEPRWRFDRIWSFEPTSVCLEQLRKVAGDDPRVEVVPAGLWSSTTEMDIYAPGLLRASVHVDPTKEDDVERCRFIDAAGWMAEHVRDDDVVWLKLNVEAAELDILDRMLEGGQLTKVDHLVVHFDALKFGMKDEVDAVRARLDAAGVTWSEADDVMFGRTDEDKIAAWLTLTEGHRWRHLAFRVEHVARRQVWRLRKLLQRSA